MAVVVRVVTYFLVVACLRLSMLNKFSSSKNMNTANQWMSITDPQWRDEIGHRPDMTPEIIQAIQVDAILYCAALVNYMSRGTKSEDRAAAIDEAVMLLMDASRMISETFGDPNNSHAGGSCT